MQTQTYPTKGLMEYQSRLQVLNILPILLFTGDPTQLKWEWCDVKSHNPSTGVVQLEIRGTNRSNGKLAFHSITAMLLRMKNMDDYPMFKANVGDWSVEGSSSTETCIIATGDFAQQVSIKVESIDNGFQFKIFPMMIDTDPDGTEW